MIQHNTNTNTTNSNMAESLSRTPDTDLRMTVKEHAEPTPLRSHGNLKGPQDTEEGLRNNGVIYEKKQVKIESPSPQKQERFKNLEPQQKSRSSKKYEYQQHFEAVEFEEFQPFRRDSFSKKGDSGKKNETIQIEENTLDDEEEEENKTQSELSPAREYFTAEEPNDKINFEASEFKIQLKDALQARPEIVIDNNMNSGSKDDSHSSQN